MAKRFIDTCIFRKDFTRSLDAPTKLLWIYILCECNHAGLFDVEWDVIEARLRLQMDKKTALASLGDKVVELSPNKWFVPDFIEFQYGELNPSNRAHKSVLDHLAKYNTHPKIKPLTSSSGACKDKESDKEKDKEHTEEESTVEGTFTDAPVSLEVAKATAAQMGANPDEVEAWWWNRDASGWLNKFGRPISRWQSDLKAFAAAYRENRAGKNGHGAAPPAKPRKPREALPKAQWLPFWRSVYPGQEPPDGIDNFWDLPQPIRAEMQMESADLRRALDPRSKQVAGTAN